MLLGIPQTILPPAAHLKFQAFNVCFNADKSRVLCGCDASRSMLDDLNCSGHLQEGQA